MFNSRAEKIQAILSSEAVSNSVNSETISENSFSQSNEVNLITDASLENCQWIIYNEAPEENLANLLPLINETTHNTTEITEELCYDQVLVLNNNSDHNYASQVLIENFSEECSTLSQPSHYETSNECVTEPNSIRDYDEVNGNFAENVPVTEEITSHRHWINHVESDSNSEVADDVQVVESTDLLQINGALNTAGEEVSDLPTENEVTKKNRKRIASPKEWLDNKNKELRQQGKSYMGWTRPKGGKGQRGAYRGERKLGPPCTSPVCKKSKVRQCEKLTEESRKELFNLFWSTMTWDQRKVYVASLVKKNPKKRCTKVAGEISRRTDSFKYTIKSMKGETLEVCKKLFLSTFSLKEWAVRNWVGENLHGMCPARKTVGNRSAQADSEKNTSDAKKFLCDFLDTLPKLPSHYCRQSTKKLYIEPIFGNNFTSVYREYVLKCREAVPSIKSLSRFTFHKVVAEKNIGFHIPKKDRCDTCISFETQNIDETEYFEHIKNKEMARAEKCSDKIRGENGECMVFTQDVQAVKMCPSLNASALYFKTKLCVHNFTVYDLCSHQARCYWFSETEADLTANTFATCIVNYLLDKADGSKPIIIWSDGCGYQNRNSIVSNALLSLSKELNVQIEQKFLEPGHTQMEADSVHAQIEKKIKNKPIHLPSDYIRFTKEAKVNNPYEVKEVSYDFIKNYGQKETQKYTSIRPGKKAFDPTVNDIKAIKYSPDGIIRVKLEFDHTYIELPTRGKRNVYKLSDFPQLRQSPIKLCARKWSDLQQLKSVIPKDCHLFYDHLPHE